MNSPASRTEALIRRATSFLSEWYPTAVFVLGTILMALGQAVSGRGRLSLLPVDWSQQDVFWLGAIVFLVGTFLSGRRQRAFESLREAHAVLQREARQAAAASQTALDSRDAVINELCCMELAFLGKQLDYFSSERITLFRPVSGGFIIAARWSLSPKFQASGRSFYPAGEGCLGQAWESRFEAETDLPSPGDDMDEWLSANETKWNVPPQTAAEFTMKSRTYIAIRLEASTGSTPLGVVVFESEQTVIERVSERPPVLEPERLKRHMKGISGQRLQGILERVAAMR